MKSKQKIISSSISEYLIYMYNIVLQFTVVLTLVASNSKPQYLLPNNRFWDLLPKMPISKCQSIQSTVISRNGIFEFDAYLFVNLICLL